MYSISVDERPYSSYNIYLQIHNRHEHEVLIQYLIDDRGSIVLLVSSGYRLEHVGIKLQSVRIQRTDLEGMKIS